MHTYTFRILFYFSVPIVPILKTKRLQTLGINIIVRTPQYKRSKKTCLTLWVNVHNVQKLQESVNVAKKN